MDTAVESLPGTLPMIGKSGEILISGFGKLDPDAEALAKLRVPKQHSLTMSEYIHQMGACFNGITMWPL